MPILDLGRGSTVPQGGQYKNRSGWRLKYLVDYETSVDNGFVYFIDQRNNDRVINFVTGLRMRLE